jgi:hypothetical protein
MLFDCSKLLNQYLNLDLVEKERMANAQLLMYRRVWGKNSGNHTYYFFTMKIGTDTISATETMLKPHFGTFDDTYLSMEYWYGEIQKLRGFACNSSPGGEDVLRGTFVQSYFFSCASRCVPYNLYGWIRDTFHVHAVTIRTWIRTPDMMEDVLNMVNFVADSHSMCDALDTYDTIFRGRSSCSIDSSGGNNTHDPPHTKSGISNIQGLKGTLLLRDKPYRLMI